MFTEKELINLPRLTVGIPVPHNTAACIMHLLRNEVEGIVIRLEDLRVEGATLILSSHIKPYPNEQVEQHDPVAQYEQEDRMVHLKQFWNEYMQEQKHKLGLDNPLTSEQIERSLQLIEEEKIKFADKSCWSDETNEYCERFEDGLFDDIDVWEEDEEDD